jgi:hypothetical protein
MSSKKANSKDNKNNESNKNNKNEKNGKIVVKIFNQILISISFTMDR